MSTEKIDVLAVMDDAADTLDDKGRARLAEVVWKAHAAVAELIERAERVAYSCINAGGDHINGFQVEADDVIALRAALARVQGGQS